MGAYEHVRVLSEDIGPRPSGSENCRKGAEYIRQELEKIAMNVHTQEFKLHPSFWTGSALLAVLFSVSIMILFLQYPVVSLILSILFPVLVIMEIDVGREAAMKALPSAVGRNVIGIVDSELEEHRQVVICAHHDSKTQAIPIKFRGAVIMLLFVSMVYLTLASLIQMIILLFFPSQMGVSWYLFLGVQIVFLYLLIYLGMNLATRFVRQSPGAEDNAAGTGTAIELAKVVKENPLQHTKVWILLTDGEEIAMKGAQAFIKEFHNDIHDAFIINLEGGGTDGEITYSEKEKSVRAARSSEKLKDILGKVASKTNALIQPMKQTTTTDGYVFARNGFESITLWRYKEEVRDVAHTDKDTIDRLNPAILSDTVKFLHLLLRHIDDM